MIDNVFLGTTVKLLVTAKEASGLDMTECEYDVYAWTSPINDRYQSKPSTGVVKRAKSACISVDQSSCIAEIQTGLIGKGYVITRLEIQVPDTDCASGYRTEVEQAVANVKVI